MILTPATRSLLVLTLAFALAACSDADRNDSVDVGPDTELDGSNLGACRNGALDEDEECDDGNETDDDACTNTCRFNTASLCGVCASSDDCSRNGLCLTLGDDTYCALDCSETEACPSGYVCQEIAEGDTVLGRQCVPVEGLCENVADPCAAGGGCDALTECLDNGDGTRACTDCPEGYTGNGADAAGCLDIDECAGPVNPCEPGVCVNDAPGYHCECEAPFSELEGACVTCAPEDALTLAFDADGCVALGEGGAAGLLGSASTNLAAVLTGTAEALQFLNDSSLLGDLGTCAEQDPDCVDDGPPFESLLQTATDIADAISEELFVVDYVTGTDTCTVSLTLPPSELCGQALPETCSFDSADCPLAYVCGGLGTCELGPCEGELSCGDGFFCDDGTCAPRSCFEDADCDSSEYYCGESGRCESYCPFLDLPVGLTLWQPAAGDVYGELWVGELNDRLNPADIRIFDGQLAVVVDLSVALETVKRFFDANRYAEEGESFPLPDADDVSGLLEIQLTRLVDDAGYAARLGLRPAEGESSGLHAEWTLVEAFESYAREVPLPVVLDLSASCPLVEVRADSVARQLGVNARFAPLSALVPFGFLANNPLFGGDGPCYDRFVCSDCGIDGGCCVDDNGAAVGCCQSDCLNDEARQCFDAEGDRVACPCFDADGRPVNCEDTTLAVSCPFTEAGDQDDCDPSVGSLRLELAGLRLRGGITVIGEGETDGIDLDEVGVGRGRSSLARDGFPVGAFDEVFSLVFDPNGGDGLLHPSLDLRDDGGALIGVQHNFEVVAGIALGPLFDRLPEAPDWLADERLRVVLGGDNPDLELRIGDATPAPARVRSGELRLSSSYLASHESPARTPPGTIIAEGGECLVERPYPPAEVHFLEQLAVKSCPSAAPIDVDTFADPLDPFGAYGDVGYLVLGGEGEQAQVYLRADVSALGTFSEVWLQLHRDTDYLPVEGTFEVREATGVWSEATLTWDAGRPGTSSTVAASVPASLLDPYQAGWLTFDVTELVADWVASPSSNVGIAIANAGQNERLFFVSSDDPDRTELHPRLLVFP